MLGAKIVVVLHLQYGKDDRCLWLEANDAKMKLGLNIKKGIEKIVSFE